nr:hypothetical protein [Tanacetum cinerariifolium]
YSSAAPSFPYVRPSRKRFHYVSSSSEISHLSSSPPPPTAVLTPPIEMLPHRKRVRCVSSGVHKDVHVETMVEARLDDHNEMLGKMYEYLLDLPLTRIEDTEQELQTLRARD